MRDSNRVSLKEIYHQDTILTPLGWADCVGLGATQKKWPVIKRSWVRFELPQNFFSGGSAVLKFVWWPTHFLAFLWSVMIIWWTFIPALKNQRVKKRRRRRFPEKNRKRRFTSGFGISGSNFDQTSGFRNIADSGKNGSSSDRSGVGVKVLLLA